MITKKGAVIAQFVDNSKTWRLNVRYKTKTHYFNLLFIEFRPP